MKTKPILRGLILLLGISVGLGFRFLAVSESGLAHETLAALAIHPGDPSKLLAATERGLYLRGEKRGWKRLLSFRGKSIFPRRLIAHPLLREKIFFLTEEGVLEGDLRSGQSKRLFWERGRVKNRVYSLALDPDDPEKFYVGTERGVFRSRDGGRTWQGPLEWPENQRAEFVGLLPTQPPTLFLGTRRELFFSKGGRGSFESGFSLPLFSEEESPEETMESQGVRFTSFAFSSRDSTDLWVGTREGVFESRDGGIQWEKLPDRGLEDRKIGDLLFSDRSQALIALTSRGVFRFLPTAKRWEKLPLGITKTPTSAAFQSLPEKDAERLLVADGNEVHEWILKPFDPPDSGPVSLPSPERIELFRKLLSLEPPVREIQKRTIRYGNLGGERIKRWHWGSRLRAVIPRVSFGKKFSLNNNIDIDRGGTNNPDVFIAGPDQTARGWDLGLTWELGDLLYSPSQTAIDGRTKLLVELRESILSEVTRIYFERRRVQTELVFPPPDQTFQERLDLLLRLDELTAQLDALTDGFLSRRLETIEEDHPEFRELFS